MPEETKQQTWKMTEEMQQSLCAFQERRKQILDAIDMLTEYNRQACAGLRSWWRKAVKELGIPDNYLGQDELTADYKNGIITYEGK